MSGAVPALCLTTTAATREGACCTGRAGVEPRALRPPCPPARRVCGNPGLTLYRGAEVSSGLGDRTRSFLLPLQGSGGFPEPRTGVKVTG